MLQVGILNIEAAGIVLDEELSFRKIVVIYVLDAIAPLPFRFRFHPMFCFPLWARTIVSEGNSLAFKQTTAIGTWLWGATSPRSGKASGVPYRVF